MDMVEILVPIAICVVLPVLLVFIIGRVRQNETNRKAEIMLKAIENGQSIDPEIFKSYNANKRKPSIKQELLDKLNGACITGLMGIGFLVLGILRATDRAIGTNTFMSPFWLPAGGVLLAVGIGLFISYFVGKKMLAKEIEAEERALDEQK